MRILFFIKLSMQNTTNKLPIFWNKRYSIYICMFKILGRVNISGHWRPKRMRSDDDNDGQMIFGNLGGLKLPDICLTGEEKPRKKTSPRKPVPTGDRTRARCVTGARATAWSTAVDYKRYATGHTAYPFPAMIHEGACG